MHKYLVTTLELSRSYDTEDVSHVQGQKTSEDAAFMIVQQGSLLTLGASASIISHERIGKQVVDYGAVKRCAAV